MNRPNHTSLKSKKGSALLAVLIFALLLTTLISTLLPLTITQYKLSQREAMNAMALFLAEGGADEAIWHFNNKTDIDDWKNNGWKVTADGNYFIKTINLKDQVYQLEKNFDGQIRIIAEVPKGSSIVSIYVEGKVTSVGASLPEAKKFLSLKARTQNPFMGLIAKDSLTFNGRPYFDSFNSATFPYTYHFGANSGSAVTVGSIATGSGTVGLGNATIQGNVVSGSSNPVSSGAVSIGSNASISGTIIGDFDQDFPDVIKPKTAGWATSF